MEYLKNLSETVKRQKKKNADMLSSAQNQTSSHILQTKNSLISQLCLHVHQCSPQLMTNHKQRSA